MTKKTEIIIFLIIALFCTFLIVSFNQNIADAYMRFFEELWNTGK